MNEYATYLIKHFKANPNYAYLRFKKLDHKFKGYPSFEFDADLIDSVDLVTFTRVEEVRIPLFIGTQFGLYPWFYDSQEFCNKERTIAVLGKSLLSGHIAGLSIIKISVHSVYLNYTENNKLITFRNEKI